MLLFASCIVRHLRVVEAVSACLEGSVIGV